MIPLSHHLSGQLIELASPITPTDYPALKEILNDRETMSALREYFKTETWTDEQVQKRYEKFHQAQVAGIGLNYKVQNKNDGKIVGDCGFKNISAQNAEAEFGIILHRDVWGKGHAIEASALCVSHGFNELNFQQIYFTTDDKNARVKKLCERIGIPLAEITQQGHLRYNISKYDWLAVKKVIERKAVS